jgi:hypothetical protein
LTLTTPSHLHLQIPVLPLTDLGELPSRVIISRMHREQEQRHDGHPFEGDLKDPKGRLRQDCRSGVGFFCGDLPRRRRATSNMFGLNSLRDQGYEKPATHQPVDGDDDEDGRIHQSRTTDAPTDLGVSEED